jgi:hypothetical protein
MTRPRLLPIPASTDLLQALASLDPGGWVQGSGHVEGVELKLPGEATEVTRVLRGRLVLVSLQGPAGGPFTAALARYTDAGIELLGGVLTRARSQGVTVLVQPASAPSEQEPAGKREAIPAPVSAPISPRTEPPTSAPATQAAPAPESPPPTRTWAEVAAASDAAEEEEGGLLPARGDLVDHFSFGLCEVLRVTGDRIQIRDVRGSGRIRDVVLSALMVMPPRRVNEKRCFRLQRRG